MARPRRPLGTETEERQKGKPSKSKSKIRGKRWARRLVAHLPAFGTAVPTTTTPLLTDNVLMQFFCNNVAILVVPLVCCEQFIKTTVEGGDARNECKCGSRQTSRRGCCVRFGRARRSRGCPARVGVTNSRHCSRFRRWSEGGRVVGDSAAALGD